MYKRFFVKLCFAICFVFCLSAFLPLTSAFCKNKVFADDSISVDESTEIKNDGTIISSNLWLQIKSFYNANVEDAKKIDTSMTITIFKNLPTTINVLDLTGSDESDGTTKIDSIKNLNFFLKNSYFDSIILKNNLITDISTELSVISNLKLLDLSKNSLTSFSYDQLSNNCYNTIEKINISNNTISICNLKGISNGEINATQNNITKDGLTLPDETSVKVYLSHNNITDPDTSKTNIFYGIQGVKTNNSYLTKKVVSYFGIENVSKVEIYSISLEKVETLLISIVANQTYTFDMGYYKLHFVYETPQEETLEDINLYIYPAGPTFQMYQNGSLLDEVKHYLTSNTKLKIVGEEGSTIVYSINNGDVVYSDEIEIKVDGIYNIVSYQIINGYQSAPTSLYIKYSGSPIKGWIYAILGVAVFVVLFYVAIKYYPRLIDIGNKSNKKKSLD